MKANRWLVAAVVILGIALTAESVYLFKIINTNTDKNKSSYPVVSPGANWSAAQPQTLPRRSAPMTSSGHAGKWNDPFFHSALDSWDPFEEMDQIQNMMNRMFRDSLNRGPRGVGFASQNMFYEPDLDVEETADAYIVRLDLPGIDKDKINVKIQNNVLTVSGERKFEKEETQENGSFYRMERSFGSFMKSFPVPADADANAMTAESKNGVLTIRLPKIKGTSALPAKNVVVQ